MRKQLFTRRVTAVVTTLIVIGALIGLLPILGPRYLMPLMMGPPPDDLNLSTTVATTNAHFRVSYTSEMTPPALNRIHTWSLHVETPDGQPVDNAVITIDGGMPQHGHGLPTQPQVTQNLGNGDYLVEGFRFQMPGWWEVKFHITVDGQSDTVTFNLVL
jgi:hypothetical protein